MVKLRDLFSLEKEATHDILFSDASLHHLHGLQSGDKVVLSFHLYAGKSVAGVNHTNLVPVKILKL